MVSSDGHEIDPPHLGPFFAEKKDGLAPGQGAINAYYYSGTTLGCEEPGSPYQVRPSTHMCSYHC